MSAPRGADASGFRILRLHWPGFPPPVERVDAGVDAPPHVRDLRLQHDVERLHRLGPRAIFELLSEIGRQRQCLTLVEDCARRYADLDPTVVRELGGDRFAGLPLREAS